MKAKILVAVAVLLFAWFGNAIAGEVPAPFSKVMEMISETPDRVHTDGTVFKRVDIVKGNLRIVLGQDADCVWVGSNQWKGVSVIISYYFDKGNLTVKSPSQFTGEYDVKPEEVAEVMWAAFEIFRKLVSETLI